MRYGIVTALASEAAPFKSSAVPSHVVNCGIGPGRASKAASELIARGVDSLLSCGYAGALSDDLRAGDLVIPDRIVDSRGNWHDTDHELSDRLRACVGNRVRVVSGELVSVKNVVSNPADKRVLGKSSKAIAVDMESYEIASVASTSNVSFAACRVVLDQVSDRLPHAALSATNATGGIDYAALLYGICRRPLDVPQLVRLGVRRRRAQRTLDHLAKSLGNA